MQILELPVVSGTVFKYWLVNKYVLQHCQTAANIDLDVFYQTFIIQSKRKVSWVIVLVVESELIDRLRTLAVTYVHDSKTNGRISQMVQDSTVYDCHDFIYIFILFVYVLAHISVDH